MIQVTKIDGINNLPVSVLKYIMEDERFRSRFEVMSDVNSLTLNVVQEMLLKICEDKANGVKKAQEECGKAVVYLYQVEELKKENKDNRVDDVGNNMTHVTS